MGGCLSILNGLRPSRSRAHGLPWGVVCWDALLGQVKAGLAVRRHPVEEEATVKTEWGVRYAPDSEEVAGFGSCESAEKEARRVAREYARHGKVLVCRTITYGPWEEV